MKTVEHRVLITLRLIFQHIPHAHSSAHTYITTVDLLSLDRATCERSSLGDCSN